ncbi:MAG TPA: OmpA family protein [Burkholderiaceae bacterium]|nr:OmpA family protein [Burkholderiaceae bacterium]
MNTVSTPPTWARPRAVLRCVVLGATAGAALVLAAGCTSTVSRGIGDDGRAAEVVFPDIERDATQPEGTFPNLDNLRAVGAGLTKDQLYDLLGRPHFREGLFAVREWDYVFNFRSGGGVTTCQYKVIFDKDYRARSFHWKPAACAAMIAPAAAGTAPPVAAPARATRQFRLSADALFAFDGIDLQAEGRREIARLASQLEGARYERIEVVGHTDRLGSPAYNQRLSEKRAEAVRGALVAQGVAPSRVVASGRGETQPVVQCDRSAKSALIACLAPNRRVDIVVEAGADAPR